MEKYLVVSDNGISEQLNGKDLLELFFQGSRCRYYVIRRSSKLRRMEENHYCWILGHKCLGKKVRWFVETRWWCSKVRRSQSSASVTRPTSSLLEQNFVHRHLRSLLQAPLAKSQKVSDPRDFKGSKSKRR